MVSWLIAKRTARLIASSETKFKNIILAPMGLLEGLLCQNVIWFW